MVSSSCWRLRVSSSLQWRPQSWRPTLPTNRLARWASNASSHAYIKQTKCTLNLFQIFQLGEAATILPLEAENLLLPPVEAPELAPHAPHQQARQVGQHRSSHAYVKQAKCT